ncbi:MAG: LamG-like jellyroll fold domain-containing protein [Verrucomicrobiota bacterium]
MNKSNEPTTPESDQQLLTLIGAWCDQTITNEEMRELNDLLRDNDETQRTFARYMSVHHVLEQLGPDESASKLIPFPSAPAAAEPRRRHKAWRVMELAAMAAVLVLAGWLLTHQGSDRNSIAETEGPQRMGLVDLTKYEVRPVETIAPERAEAGFAILTHTVDAEWQEGAREIGSGAILGQGRVQLAEGLAHLQFYNGVSVTLEGPVDFEILSMDEAFCWNGKIHTSVPLHAFGFIVHTPTGELIDLGTAYGLMVGSDGSSEIHVFDGEVEFRNPHQETVANLTPGKAARIDEFGRRIPLIADEDMFVTGQDLRQLHAIITEQQLAGWYRKNERWRNDERMLAYFDFDGSNYIDGVIPVLTQDPYRESEDGIVIGTRLAQGRWNGKIGLEFMRPSDRVRVRVPGYHDALTMATWVRIDRLESRGHGLLLSDGYDHGAVHWEIDGKKGRVVLSTRREEGETVDYASPKGSIDEQLFGQWVHLACVYDRLGGTVTHYLNGEELSSHAMDLDVRLRVGIGEIGNWATPMSSNTPPVRNFIGVMDEFTVFQEALRPEEIAQLKEDGDAG